MSAIDWPEGLEPCPTEDSLNCYWDAAVQGNGTGRSFWTDGNDVVHYVPDVITMSGRPATLATAAEPLISAQSAWALGLLALIATAIVVWLAWRKVTYRPVIVWPAPDPSTRIQSTEERQAASRGRVRFVEDPMSVAEETYRRYAGKLEDGYTVR